MLQRVFAGAHSEGEYSAAHNAAFSLARLYGHVTDRATLEVMRRPSRDPDAPSEQMLEAWAASLPVVSGPEPQALPLLEEASKGPPRGAPAALSGPETEGPGPRMHVDVHSKSPNDINDLAGPGPYMHADVQRPGLGGEGEIGNGAPVGPVTMTPDQRGPQGPLEKGAPSDKMRVPPPPGGWPKIEDLF
jgi:hypothetical protein